MINSFVLEEEIDKLKTLNGSLISLICSLSENVEVGVDFNYDLESKLLRVAFANQSILNLTNGIKLKISAKEINTRDVFSIYSLSRMQIESFLMLFYLFFDNITDEEKDFRYELYKLHGLIKQSKFKATKKESFEKRELVLAEIEDVKDKLIKNDIFIFANEKEQRNYLKGSKAKIHSSEILFEKIGFTTLNIDGIWSLYSNHIHSEHIGDRQFNSMFKEKMSTDDETVSVTMINSVLTAKLCCFLIDSCKLAEDKFNRFTDLEKVLIKTYNFPI
jgi:hypothetical protein